jgi:hypothetical protein
MNWVSARCRRAICPFITVKRAPEILTPASKSSPPSAVPRSTWSRGAAMARGVPQRSASTLPVSSRPTGTLSCGRLGISSRKVSKRGINSASAASPAFSASPRPATSAITAEASSPLPLSMPICLDSVLRLACRSCVCTCRRLRSASRASKPAVSSVTPRVARRSATRARLLRRSWMSSMVRPYFVFAACASSVRRWASFSAIFCSSPRATGWYHCTAGMPSGK